MKIRLNIEGLDCPNCAAKLALMIEKKEGVTSAKINFLSEKLTVESDLDEAELMGLITDACRAFDPAVKVSK